MDIGTYSVTSFLESLAKIDLLFTGLSVFFSLSHSHSKKNSDFSPKTNGLARQKHVAAYGSHLAPVVQCQGHRALGWHLKAQASPMATGRQKAPSQRRKQLPLHHGEKKTSCGVLLTGLNGGVLSLHPRTHPPGCLWMEGQQQHQAQTPPEQQQEEEARLCV